MFVTPQKKAKYFFRMHVNLSVREALGGWLCTLPEFCAGLQCQTTTGSERQLAFDKTRDTQFVAPHRNSRADHTEVRTNAVNCLGVIIADTDGIVQ